MNYQEKNKEELINLLLKLDKENKTLTEDKLRLQSIIKGTNVGTWEWNLQTGEAIFSEEYSELVESLKK